MTNSVPRDSSDPRPQAGQASALHIAAVLLRARRLVLSTAGVAAVAALALSLALPRTYTVRSSFIPQSLNQPDVSALSGLSAQLGLGSLTSAASAFASPDFYKKLLETETLLGEMADSTFDFPEGNGRFSGTLATYWKVRGATPARAREAVVRKLRAKLEVRVDPRIQLTEVSAVTTSPGLSKALVDRALELVSRFNQERRQSQSAQEARFIGARLEEVRRGLNDAEDAAAQFMQQNRDLRSSAFLMNRYERLQREVTLRQSVYAALSQRYEQSRIEEVRDTPVLTVVERAQAPAAPDPRALGVKLAVALLAGFLIGIFFALGEEYLSKGDRREDDLTLLRRALSELRDDARRPWRVFLRRPA